MRRIARVAIALAVPMVALATALEAQLAGIPVYYNPRGGTGIGVAANIGVPNKDAGGGTAYGVSASLGTGPVTLSGMVGAWKASDYGWAGAQPTFGGSLSYRILGGGLLPIAVAAQGGFGVVKAPATCLSQCFSQTWIPVGIGVSFDPPLFPIKPWIAPRLDFVSGAGSSKSSFRVSAGANFNLLLGLGLHAAVDFGQSKITTGTTTTTVNPFIWSVGAHFNFHMPMM